MRLSVLAAVLLFAACTAYTPQPLDPPPPVGTSLRARLTTPGAVRLSGLFGQPVQQVEGELLSLSGDSLGLALYSAVQYARPWDSVDTLLVAKEEIFQLDQKSVDRARTALLVGGVGVASGVVIVALFRAATRSESGDPPGEIDVSLIPLLNFLH